jgi:hypothetical protein
MNKLQILADVCETQYSSQLLDILNNKNINHSLKILECETLKDAHEYCLVNRLSGQQTGPLIEKFIIHKGGMCKINASECQGDGKYNENFIEIKVSLGGQNRNKFNYVQIRPSHDVEYYILTAYYLDWSNIIDNGELFIFLIKKPNMINLLEKYGSYAHGTIKQLGKISKESILNSSNVEYALRPTYGDDLWSNLLEYRYTKSDLPIEF